MAPHSRPEGAYSVLVGPNLAQKSRSDVQWVYRHAIKVRRNSTSGNIL